MDNIIQKTYYKGLVDMNTNTPIEDGHIVAVRYVWNSYVGEINFRFGGLYATGAKRHAFYSPHSIQKFTTYQIIGHINENHKDYNEEVLNWYKSEDGEFECPVKLTIYENMKIN